MPTYEYECTKGHQFEAEQSIHDAPLKRCRKCRSKVRRLISASSFILKGGGWYSDGYGSSKPKSENASGAGSDSKSDSGGSSKSESKSEPKSESKPDAKPASKPDAKSDAKPSGKSGKPSGGSAASTGA
jgi:putative FmdB family regulatory protein